MWWKASAATTAWHLRQRAANVARDGFHAAGISYASDKRFMS
jgi:hypothetical protein